MSYYEQGSSAPGCIWDLQAFNSIDILLSVNGGKTFFKHVIETYIPFAKEYYAQKMMNVKAQGDASLYSVKLEKAFDYLVAVVVEVTLPAIIGKKGSDTHAFPYLVSTASGCDFTAAGGYTNCLPSRELIASNFTVDFQASAVSGLTSLEAGFSLTQMPFAHWIQGAPLRFLETFYLKTGTVEACKIDYLAAYVLEELEGSEGRRQSYAAGFHDSREECIRASLTAQKYYVKIPMWFEMHTPLNVVNMQLADLNFCFKAADLTNLIQCSDSLTVPYLAIPDPAQADWFRKAGNVFSHPYMAGTILTNDVVIPITMVQEVIYIDDDHRQQEMIRGETTERNVLQQLVEVVYKEYLTPVSEFTVTLRGTNPIVEMFVFLRLNANVKYNEPFNFTRVGPIEGGRSGKDANPSVNGVGTHQTKITESFLDPLTSIEIQINGQTRWAKAPAEQYRIVTHGRCHSRLPTLENGCYVYGFSHALYPEEKHTGSGSIQLGRVEGLKIICALHPQMMYCTSSFGSGFRVYCVAKMWGIFSTFSNSGGIRFQTMLQVQEY
jgi:hypothetical protein